MDNETTTTQEIAANDTTLLLYTVLTEDQGSFSDCRKLWKSREGALAWLKDYRKPGEQDWNDWLARTNGNKGYYYIATVPVRDCNDVDDLPDEMFVCVSWIWGNDEDAFYAPTSASVLQDAVHTPRWQVLP